jgi:hypothetical protein
LRGAISAYVTDVAWCAGTNRRSQQNDNEDISIIEFHNLCLFILGSGYLFHCNLDDKPACRHSFSIRDVLSAYNFAKRNWHFWWISVAFRAASCHKRIYTILAAGAGAGA